MSLLLAAYPVLGLALGALAAAVAALAGLVAPALAGPAGVLALEATSRLRPRRALAAATRAGWLLAAVVLVAKVGAAAAIPVPALASALLLASMLGHWAMVVLCYGGAPIVREGGDELPGRAGFGEFGWASLTAFAVTLSIAEAIGLVLLLVAALVTLGIRLASHRRLGGVDGRVVRAAGDLVEAAVLGALAGLATTLGR
jgi:cobalamin synthase